MEYIFVYGAFRDAYAELLKNSVYCDRTFVYGKIYQVNDFYPGLKRDKESIVYGDIYMIDPNIFDELDEFEGEEYTREKIWTSQGIECWVYIYKYDIEKFNQIKCGDWLLR